eukprot:10031104-Alexandrium_andersonii.AAC.1
MMFGVCVRALGARNKGKPLAVSREPSENPWRATKLLPEDRRRVHGKHTESRWRADRGPTDRGLAEGVREGSG